MLLSNILYLFVKISPLKSKTHIFPQILGNFKVFALPFPLQLVRHNEIAFYHLYLLTLAYAPVPWQQALPALLPLVPEIILPSFISALPITKISNTKKTPCCQPQEVFSFFSSSRTNCILTQ